MKTNLIFKRSIELNGVSKVEMKIVAVEIPNIEENSGWVLSGHADIVDTSCSLEETIENEAVCENSSKSLLVPGDKFTSSVPGSARLIRLNGQILIAYRKGKTTYNETTPNSVCINDTVKSEFFNSCRKTFGDNCSSFKCTERDHKLYSYWNSFIDREYINQLQDYNSKLAKGVV